MAGAGSLMVTARRPRRQRQPLRPPGLRSTGWPCCSGCSRQNWRRWRRPGEALRRRPAKQYCRRRYLAWSCASPTLPRRKSFAGPGVEV